MRSVATPSAQEIAGEFSDAMHRLGESQLVVVLDDYQACLRIAAVAGDRRAVAWLEDRVNRIVDAYDSAVNGGSLPF